MPVVHHPESPANRQSSFVIPVSLTNQTQAVPVIGQTLQRSSGAVTAPGLQLIGTQGKAPGTAIANSNIVAIATNLQSAAANQQQAKSVAGGVTATLNFDAKMVSGS